MPVLNDLARQYAKQGLVVLAVNVERSRAAYQSFIKSNRYTYLQWARDSTGEISKAYRVRAVPVTYVVDKDGIIRYVHLGYSSGLKKTFAQEVESLLE